MSEQNASSPKPTCLGEHAIVIGASFAGLVSARILSDYFSTVTIIDRDHVCGEAGHRIGTPQDGQVHVLLKGGEDILSDLFPGFDQDLAEAGSNVMDMGSDLQYYKGGRWRPRWPSGFKVHAQSRPFLEGHLRERVKNLTGVTIMERARVSGFFCEEGSSQIGGVTVHKIGSDQEDVKLKADFVVDASGRGSGTPRWLKTLGYEPPEESLIKINLGYTSRFYRLPDDPSRDWEGIGFNTTGPNEPCGGGVYPIDNGRWVVTLVGYFGDHAPEDEQGFLEFARDKLPDPSVYEAIKDAEPLGPITRFKFVGNRRLHYDQLDRFPERLVVLGDAHASLNPLFGQGMAKAALEADALRQCLAACAGQSKDALNGLASGFFAKTSKIIDGPWDMTSTEDYKYPQTAGPRPRGFSLKCWYQSKFGALIESDPELFAEAFRVGHFMEPISQLKRPSLILRTLLTKAS